MVKILILTGDAGESLEVMYPLQRMREEGGNMDDLIKWKIFSIPMTTVFVIGLVEILFLHQYFGILGIIAFCFLFIYNKYIKIKVIVPRI